MKKLLLPFIVFFSYFFFTEEVKASCNFQTGNYINQLSFPNSIKRIDIQVKNPRKYVINSLGIVTSKFKNIHPKFKKKFRANIKVDFDFGSCSYKAKIWQNGDVKDHIKLIDGNQIIRSLNVKLEEGNILNATKFKLFIPETRQNYNELLGTLILKNIGFITPETFEVEVKSNNYISKMLFQEDSQKELLERNLRREGPIFEGDETILWKTERDLKKDFFRKDFEYLSLSRLINSKWFLGGQSSQEITLWALYNLQKSYLERASVLDADFYVNPNNLENDIFSDYRFLQLSMNGTHGLRPHNMKYYFNSFEDKFEPIYYDGDLQIINPINKNKFIKKIESIKLAKEYSFPYFNLIDEESFIKNIKQEFKNRVIKYNHKHDEFINQSITNFVSNMKFIQGKIDNKKTQIISRNDNRSLFLEKNAILNAEKNIIKNFNINNNGVDLILEDGRKFTTDINTFSKFISRKEVDKEKYLFLPKHYSNPINQKLIKTKIPELFTEIIHPKSTQIIFENDNLNPKLTIIQTDKNQSILINGGKLNNLFILFKGHKSASTNKSYSQRFNNRGLTGCLNIYKANLKNTSIELDGGECEDSLNIVSSKGNLMNIVVNDAFQDAVDLDFSDLSINQILVNNAGNDCLDVSAGNYLVSNINLENCFDKAISVGEKSFFKANLINIKSSNIGVAVKDLSKFFNEKITIKDSSNCFQVFQKKQEFGGALVNLKDVKCVGDYQVDDN